MAATLLLKGVAFPLNSNPLQRIRRSISSPLPRIMIVARAPPRARDKSNETVGSVPRTLESQESVDAPNEVTKLFSSTGTLNMAPASLKNWNLTDRHLFLLSAIACAMGGAVIALFVAAIPTLLAFKRAAESLEKLLEVTREELPGTMAAVRLSGMEISDLTMELSELGQEISSGVKSSARAVRAAQDGLRRVSNIASTVFLQEPRAAPAESMNLTVTPTARGLHERLMQVRLIFHSVATLKYLTGCIRNLWMMRKSQSPRSTTTNYTSNIQHARNTF